MSNEDLSISTEARSILGFVSWREGKFKQALETFRPLLEPDLLERLGDRQAVVVAGATQNYIETVLEMLQYEPNQTKRSQVIQVTEVLAVAERLQQVHEGVGLDYLARIALYMLENYNGTRLDPVEIQAFFEECCAMEEWASASLTTQLLLSLSFRRGMYALLRVSPKLIRRRNWKLFLKNIVGAIYAVLGDRFLFLIKLLNGRTLMPFFVGLMEFQYGRKRGRWKRDWEKGTLRVE